jgi:hypothetical protein
MQITGVQTNLTGETVDIHVVVRLEARSGEKIPGS